MAKRGHEWPKSAVPPSLINHPSPSKQLYKESENQDIVRGDSSSRNEKSIDEGLLEDETLELEIKVDPEARSAIGAPVVTDECTTNKLIVSYAHILVEVDITQPLVKEIAIKDCEGRKMKQVVEYEWKPLYCEKCQKMGHQCGATIKGKHWKPKFKPPVINQDTTSTAMTPKEDPKQHNDDSGENLTKVSKTTRDKGKSITYVGSTFVVNCQNGFEALRVLNDPLVAFDRGPC
ncbi:hypothetical protein KIW84_013409 [Lathyrus oleraceus]|uniref:Uncharacterized protein n=1 Tax=Pisum sativum TaxID=3888 RepID=A0A9D5GXS1_PEA|nr:hypothetical protein KIW84_013409 [Pisum sativum]